ncbi:IS66 family insertion sequence element accessory protein TnpB (plasmid) [Klebsiella pneumoniae]|nr:IS66 family insertion sequence element accessory protein TnpB [Klebsiella pneumoniae]
MISLPSGTRIWLVAGATDMRKSFNGLAKNRYTTFWMRIPSPAICLSSGTPWRYRENTLADADGLCLFIKRLVEGQFVWPAVRDGKIAITRSQLAMLLDKLDWRQAQGSKLADNK